MARPVPVLPEVGSTIVPPGRRCAGLLGGFDHRQADAVLRPNRPGSGSRLGHHLRAVSDASRDRRTSGVLPPRPGSCRGSRPASRSDRSIRLFCCRAMLPSVTADAELACPVQRPPRLVSRRTTRLARRRTRDPHAILVAEVMLQQTQADRVIPTGTPGSDAFQRLTTWPARPGRRDSPVARTRLQLAAARQQMQLKVKKHTLA